MRIAALAKPDDGCCYYRIILPLDYMNWGNDEVKIFYPNKTSLEGKDKTKCDHISEIEIFNPDIIFLNRTLFDKDLNWLALQKDKGVKIVVDIDDFWEIGPLHPYHSFWYKYEMNTKIKETIKLADLVLTTSHRLKAAISLFRLNRNCEVIPNAVPFGDKHFTSTTTEKSSKMNFLYAGGSSHYQDIALLRNKFDRLGSDPSVRNSAVFTLAGFNPLQGKHCEWDKMASIFKRTNSYQILDTLPIQEHMSFYDSADVVLVPLVKNEFNQYKSVLKIIEAATRELPCIVSDVPPYSDLKDYPGILWEDWIKNIKYSIKNPTFVQDQGKLLAEKVKENFDLRYWATIRYDLFKNLMKC